MVRLKELLTEYKALTLEIVSSLEAEDYTNLDELLEKKQSIIENINKMDYTKEEFKDICDDLNIQVLQRRLDGLFQEKLNTAREELKKTMAGRQINNTYGQSSQVDSIFFNKKI